MKQRKSIHLIAFCLTVLFLATSLPMMTIAETVAETTAAEQALLAEIETMLAQERVPGELIVMMREGVTLEQAKSTFREVGLTDNYNDTSVYLYRSHREEPANNQSVWFTIGVSEQSLANVLFELADDDNVRTVIPNFISLRDDIEIETATDQEIAEADAQAEADISVDSYDPDTSSWAMEKMGVATAWSLGMRGKESVTIAVLDSGYNPHVDVSCVDTTHSINTNLYDEDTDTCSLDITDESGHGTFIVGQIGAALNGSRVNGICQNVTIVPIKISWYSESDNKDHASASSMARAFAHAETIGADIINLSFSLSSESGYNDICDAQYSGVVVTSAGNSGQEIAKDPAVQAGKANDNPAWIVVGNSTSNDTRASSSNYSAVYVDLFAPGVSIVGLNKDGFGIDIKGGTSMAAPHVAAAAALLLSYAPDLTPGEVRQWIIDTATPVEALEGKCVSGGRLSISGIVGAMFSVERDPYSPGDCSGDGSITSVDYMILKRTVLRTYTPEEQQLSGMDVNKDGKVNAVDYMLLKRHVLRTSFIPLG